MKRIFPFLLLLILISCNTSKHAEQEKNVDVLVIGGTTSGTSAGISSAREGANTLIVEATPWLGGMFTAQGVGACDGNHNLPSGIWNEFREQLRIHYGGAEALNTGWVSNTLFEPHVGDSIFKSMASKEKNLEVIYKYHFVDVIKDGNTIKGAIFENDAQQRLIVNATVTIDATDIGETLKAAGAEYRLGMDSQQETGEANAPEKANDIVQDLTWVAILKDYGEGADKTIEKPANYNPYNFKGSCKDSVNSDVVDCDQMLNYAKLPNNKYMINWPKKGNDIYLNVIELSRDERNKELEAAKNQTLQFIYYIQHELGYKNLGLADDEFDTPDLLAYSPYHREGRRVKGMSYLTYNHVAAPYDQKEKLYRTGISVGDYPVDHHHDRNTQAPHIGFPPVPSFNVPLGALIPEKVDGLVVSDKAISVSNLINGSTRLQPVVLLTGQAAGTLAGIAVKQGKQPRDISIREVQKALLKSKAFIVPLFDVKPDEADFETLQKIAATGILKTTGEPYKWANRTWFYPNNKISEKEFTEGLNGFNPEIKISTNLKNITEKQVLTYIIQCGGKDIDISKAQSRELTRKEIALLLDKYINPFEKEIDFSGSYK